LVSTSQRHGADSATRVRRRAARRAWQNRRPAGVSFDPPVHTGELTGVGSASALSVVDLSSPLSEAIWAFEEFHSIEEEAARRGIEISPALVTTAKEQVESVRQFVATGASGIVIYPMDTSVLRAVSEAMKAGTPVILIESDSAGLVAGTDYTAIIAPDFVNQGERAAEWLTSNMSSGEVVEIKGPPILTRTTQRSDGFRRIISMHPELRVVNTLSGSFDRRTGAILAEAALSANPNLQAIYTHDDELALGAIEAVRRAGKRPGVDVMIVSIQDGSEGLRAIIDGELNATVANMPIIGAEVFDLLERIEKGQPVPPFMPKHAFVFDLKNAKWGLEQWKHEYEMAHWSPVREGE
jgi:ABC-type sugar transport system substrate-binding protein